MGREGKQAQSRRGAKGSSPGLCLRCFKETKVVSGDQIEVLEILGKKDQSGHRKPIRMSKTTRFPGRNAISPKRGGGRGGQKCRILGENAIQSGQTRSFGAHFGRNRASLGAFERILIESMLESGPKRPHRKAQPHRNATAGSCPRSCRRSRGPAPRGTRRRPGSRSRSRSAWILHPRLPPSGAVPVGRRASSRMYLPSMLAAFALPARLRVLLRDASGRGRWWAGRPRTGRPCRGRRLRA